MKKLVKFFSAAIVATGLATTAYATDYITIATGGTSGVYYPLGVAISEELSKELPSANVSVQSTKASVENVNLLEKGRAELAFALGDTVADAAKGDKEAGFTQPLTKLRAIGGIYSNYIQIVATQASGIKTLSDLKGKRISVGPARSGTELNARAIFAAAGLSYKDFKQVQYLPFGQSVDLIKNGQLDATLQSSGLGASSIRDLASTQKIVLIPIPESLVKKIGNPAYQPGIIPANSYEGQTSNVPTVRIQNILVTRQGVSDKVAYAMAKAVFGHLPVLVAAHNAAKGIKIEDVANHLPIPLHPGAEKYFREIGVVK